MVKKKKRFLGLVLHRSKKHASKGVPKRQKKAHKARIIHPKTHKEPKTQAPHTKKVKKILHDMYFSKKGDEILEKEKANAKNIKDLEKGLTLSQKEMEKKLIEIEKGTENRTLSAEQFLSFAKDVIENLRKENEELKKERQMLIDKLNSVVSQQKESNDNYEKEADTTKESSSSGEKNVKTSLDQLLEIIMQKGQIKISDAAKKLKVKDKQIEEWSHMLEEHGLIEIHYRAMGKPILKKK